MASSNAAGTVNQGNGGFLGFGAQSPYYTPGAYNNPALDGLINNPNAGAQAAVNNPYLSSILGSGGSLSQAEQQATQLQNQGFSLQPQDYTAYGQASNQAAQLYGAQGSSLANSLAQRGFGAGNGGNVAGAQFTGLQGNKNEQLQQAQYGIANQRMQFAQNALNSTRQAITSMAGLGNQYASTYNQGQESAANAYNTGYEAQNNAGFNQAKQQGEGMSPSFGQVVGGGLAGMLNVSNNAKTAAGIIGASGGLGGKPSGGGGLGGGGGSIPGGYSAGS